MTVYAAQAAEVIFDAIARSNPTRESVLRELFSTRVQNGLLGSFSFDANGDITESPVTILKVTDGRGSNRIAGAEGGFVHSVVRPSPARCRRRVDLRSDRPRSGREPLALVFERFTGRARQVVVPAQDEAVSD